MSTVYVTNEEESSQSTPDIGNDDDRVGSDRVADESADSLSTGMGDFNFDSLLLMLANVASSGVPIHGLDLLTKGGEGENLVGDGHFVGGGRVRFE